MTEPENVRPPVDVLIPTYRRATSLAITLAGLASQSYRPLRIVVSDQTEDEPLPSRSPEVEGVVRVLDGVGIPVERHRHIPPRGMAEHRQSLLDRARAPYALFLDDDVLLEHDLVERLVRGIRAADCGFVGSALVGLSHRGDVRPHEEAIEFWDGGVRPEVITPDGAAWGRHRLHNAANLRHVQDRLRATQDRLYKVAWVGGCVLYDVAKLRATGGFRFWRRLPMRHAGEDVLAQQQVMARFGGAGLFPSGAYHLELPTTIDDRRVDAPRVLTPSRARGAVLRRQGIKRRPKRAVRSSHLAMR
ncbi:MAG: glycosyltransferase family A protein [Chloroflexota bacterium]